MFTYTKYMIETNHFPVEFITDDLYHSGMDDDILVSVPITNSSGWTAD